MWVPRRRLIGGNVQIRQLAPKGYTYVTNRAITAPVARASATLTRFA
jgi:hypothetical protein